MSTKLSTYNLPFNTLRTAFETLVAEPCHMFLPGEALGHGLPERDIAVAEIQPLLMNRKVSRDAKRALWQAIIELSREGQAAWTVVAAGLAYPGLVSKTLYVCESTPGDRHEIQAEIVTEFLTALTLIDLDDPDIDDIAGWLCFRALTASWKLRVAESSFGTGGDDAPESAIPLFDIDHPDLILARAIRQGILSPTEAEMIGRLYLEGQHPKDVAAALPSIRLGRSRGTTGVSPATFYRYRNEAVAKLVLAIETGALRPY